MFSNMKVLISRAHKVSLNLQNFVHGEEWIKSFSKTSAPEFKSEECGQSDQLVYEYNPRNSAEFGLDLDANTDAMGEPSRRSSQKRKRIELPGLSDCICGTTVSAEDNAAQRAVQCQTKGCKTVWYHMECVSLHFYTKTWTCEACSSSGNGKRR
ncbi:hypothetical protein BT96DRAFT_887617 [Gymnopus androsaceus JB14]|uniref:Zinc finger PHD-type domain-containing protein n=1 Tax=Gymnopus androsaceus JB14 TaxID=1447944 RepID=A0A6A4H6Y7_9AGAR|nr:hypothetical protein BT96DRAFT_887617 [Gymnopus androsaceus JB14]